MCTMFRPVAPPCGPSAALCSPLVAFDLVWFGAVADSHTSAGHALCAECFGRLGTKGVTSGLRLPISPVRVRTEYCQPLLNKHT